MIDPYFIFKLPEMNYYKKICFFAHYTVCVSMGRAQVDTIGLGALLKMANNYALCDLTSLINYPASYKLESTMQQKCVLYIQAHPNYKSVFLLEALKLLRSDQLKSVSKGCQAAIYGDLFNRFSCMDNWVNPYPRMDSIRFSDSYTTLDFITTGDTAIFYLKKSLYNKKRIWYLEGLRDGPALPQNAPLEHRDIAYYLIHRILKKSYVRLPRDLAQRDANIKKLIQQLNLFDEDTFNKVLEQMRLHSKKLD